MATFEKSTRESLYVGQIALLAVLIKPNVHFYSFNEAAPQFFVETNPLIYVACLLCHFFNQSEFKSTQIVPFSTFCADYLYLLKTNAD